MDNEEMKRQNPKKTEQFQMFNVLASEKGLHLEDSTGCRFGNMENSTPLIASIL